MDLKTGVTVVLLFAIMNKVAGVYGLITLFTGGSVAQLSLYFYSICMLVVIWWFALRVVLSEHPKYTLWVAYGFLLDHVLSTAWLANFAVEWWYYTPHDGRRVAHSAAQEQLMGSVGGYNMTEAERTVAAEAIWNTDKGPAGLVLLLGWLVKWYFAAVIFAYANRLRSGTYRSIPQFNVPLSALPHPDTSLDEDEDGAADGYYFPPQTPGTATSFGSYRGPMRTNSMKESPDRGEVLWEEDIGDDDE